MAKCVITETGRRKLCMAHAGDIELPKIAEMALGDGGLDENGEDKATTGNEIALYHEVFRKAVDSHVYVDEAKTTCRYSLRVEKGELVKKAISELGLYDEEGDLVAYKTCLKKEKDEDMSFIFDADEIFTNL